MGSFCCSCIDPKLYPQRFCALSCCISIAISLTAFLCAFYNPPSSKNASATNDAPLIFDAMSDSFQSSSITHNFTLNTNQYPNTYGVIVYIGNDQYSNFNASIQYKSSGARLSTNCTKAYIRSHDGTQFKCDIQPAFFENNTLFTLTLSGCDGYCHASTSIAFLSIHDISSKTKYALQTSFDPWDYVSRYHYFTVNTKGVESFKISIKDDQGDYQSKHCVYRPDYHRCIYAAPKSSQNVSFVDSDTAKYKNCNLDCGYKEWDGSYYIETLSVDVDSDIDEYLVSIDIDFDGYNSTDFYNTDLNLFMEDKSWVYIWSLVGGAIFIVVCCMIPAFWYWCKDEGRWKYKQWQTSKKKQKFLKEWKLFYMDRYNILMNVFDEKGVVDLIQSYMDDLEIIYDLRDDRVFSSWYSKKYNFKEAAKIGLDKPFLVN